MLWLRCVKMSETYAVLKKIPVDEIVRSPLNPRLRFGEKKMQSLRDSIQKGGVLVPITVFRRSKDGKYCVIDGERRWMCAKELNHKEISAVIIPNARVYANLHKQRCREYAHALCPFVCYIIYCARAWYFIIVHLMS